MTPVLPPTPEVFERKELPRNGPGDNICSNNNSTRVEGENKC